MSTASTIQKDNSSSSLLNPADAYRQLKDILRAQPWIECDLISLKLDGRRAILTGAVYSPAEREKVEAAARKLAGILEVDNEITLIKEQQAKNA